MPAKIQRKVGAAPVKTAAASPAGNVERSPIRGTIKTGKISNRQLVQFTTQLATLSGAGLPIVRALSILEKQLPSGALKQVLASVSEDVASGTSLSESLAKHPVVFDHVYTNLVRAGEVGGVLDQILKRLSEFLERTQAIRDRIKGAIAYPVVVTLVAIGVLSIVFIFVIPKFEEIFNSFDIELPFVTQLLIGASRFVADFWYIVFGLPILAVFALRASYQRSVGFRRACHQRVLQLPAIGPLVNKTLIARFARTFGTLIGSGVAHLEALSIVRDSMGNEIVGDAIEKIRSSVREGEGMSRPMQEAAVFDEMIINMVDVGEETGELDRMLLKVADAYEDEVDKKMEIFFKILEPALLVAMAVAVGFIVISLFLPLLKIMDTLGSG